MTISSSTSVDFTFFSGLIISSFSPSFLLPVIPNITKLFYIRKPVTKAYNTLAIKILKSIIWTVRISILFLDKAWQYMLGIPDLAHSLKVLENFPLQKQLLTKIINSKHKTIMKLLKK